MEDQTIAGQKPSLPVPSVLAVQGRGHLPGTRCPCKRGPVISELMQHGEPRMVGSRQCGLCATPGACPCELLFEGLQSLNSLRRGLPSLWFGKGVAGFIVLEGFQAHRVVPALDKCPTLRPGLCCVLFSWSRDPPGREGCKPVLSTLRAPPLQDSCCSTRGAGPALPLPKPVSKLRSGCRALAVGMSRHQLPGMQTSEEQLAFRSTDNW